MGTTGTGHGREEGHHGNGRGHGGPTGPPGLGTGSGTGSGTGPAPGPGPGPGHSRGQDHGGARARGRGGWNDPYAAAAGPLRTRMVRRITASGSLTYSRWLIAFADVPRHLFVPVYYRPCPGGGYTRLSAADPDPRGRARWLAGAYADQPLATRLRDGRLVTSCGQPSLTAAMVEALGAEDGNRVLEIGTGSGYGAALLAHRLGPDAVTTVDLDPAITSAARAHLSAAGHPVRGLTGGRAGEGGIAVATGDGAWGCPARAPYDRIIAGGELPRVPAEWLRQCRPGGLVVAPFRGGLVALRVTGPGHAEGRFLTTPGNFVSLRGAAAGARPAPEAIGPEEQVRTTEVPPSVLQNELFHFLLTLRAGELDIRWAFGGRGASLIAPDGSAARCDRGGTVLLAGPRDLWALVEDAYAMWQREKRPARNRFGLTVEGERQWVWLDGPDGPHTWPVN